MNRKLERIFDFILMSCCILSLHEIGHGIGIDMIGFPAEFIIILSNIEIGHGVFGWRHTAGILPMFPFIDLFWMMLVLPLILEFSFIYLSGQSRWWYLGSLFLHRFDIIMLMNLI